MKPQINHKKTQKEISKMKKQQLI